MKSGSKAKRKHEVRLPLPNFFFWTFIGAGRFEPLRLPAPPDGREVLYIYSPGLRQVMPRRAFDRQVPKGETVQEERKEGIVEWEESCGGG